MGAQDETKGLYQQKQTWWLRFTPAPGAGQQRVSLGTRDFIEAVEKARELRRRSEAPARAAVESCAFEVERYIAHLRKRGLSKVTIYSRQKVLEQFIEAMGVETPRYLTVPAVQRWYDKRCEQHAHTATAYLHIVHYWLDWLVEQGRLVMDVTKDVQRPKLKMQVRKTFLLPEQAKRLIAECKDEGLKFALYCALHAGLRKLEIIEARPEWFDLKAGLLHVQATETFQPKDRDNRTIPLTTEFCRFLKRYKLRAPFMLAPTVKHGKYRYRYDFRKPYAKLLKELKLNITFHDLRRTFASLHVSKGTSIYKVAKWLGDEVDVVQATYGHLLPQDKTINAIWR